MAKQMNRVTVTVTNDNSEETYVAPQAIISGNGDQYHPVMNIRLDLYEKVVKPFTIPFQTDQENSEDPHTTKVRQHTEVILDVLKAAETTRLNSALKREKFEAELAAQERADRIALTFAVHNAIQAGVQEEEVTETLRDDHCCYVADMFEKVYLAVDLDTVLNRP